MLDKTAEQFKTPLVAEANATPGADESADALDPNRRRTEGHIIHCDSKTAVLTAEVDPKVDYLENYWSVGQLISIWVGKNRVIGQTAKVRSDEVEWIDGGRNRVTVEVELIGEIFNDNGKDRFTTGISGFPQMGCIAHRIRSTDLAAIYENNAKSTITIGHLTQDRTIEAKIDFDKLLSRHFAVVGSTGVGKSTSVSLMLRKIVEARPDIRVLMLDPHNEFSTAFPDNSIVINASNLALPFWLFGLEEISEVIFRGQVGLDAEKELLRDFIAAAKTRHQEENEKADSPSLVKKNSGRKNRINADTPLPYRLPDLLKLIDQRLGMLDNKSEKPVLKSLKDRIETISNDARFQFMFDPTTCGGDKISDVISRIFRIPQNGKPICVMEMSGLPSEVVSSVVSVLCRMAFDLGISSEGAIQTLVVCEEAHRYIPAKADEGFWPTRNAIGRIAKEGRKYGVFLGIITQRPGELDPTILSQCNSFFAMRLSNKKDQEIIAGAFNSGAASTISFLPSISNRECIAFGEALYTPMRMTFETVAAKDLPGANIRKNQDEVRAGRQINLQTVISKMRGAAARIQPEPVDELAELANSGLRSDRPDRRQQPERRAALHAGQSSPPIGTPATPPAASSIQQRYEQVQQTMGRDHNPAASATGDLSMPQATQQPADKPKNAGNALFRAFREK